MNCHVCGWEMETNVTSLPFKVSDLTILIVKNLPVHQCINCGEYLIDDPVMERLDQIMESIDSAAELEVIGYVA